MTIARKTKPTKTMTDLKQEMIARTGTDVKVREQNERDIAQAKETVEAMDLDEVLVNLTTLGNTMARELLAIGEKIRIGTEQLKAVDTMVAAQKEHLQVLHDMDTAQTNIDRLVAEYEAKSRELELQTQKDNQDYATEKAEREARWAAEDATRIVERKRENEQYNYQLNHQRTRDNDQYEQLRLARERTEQAERSARVALLEQREATLKLAEKELTDLRATVAAYPELTRKEAEKAASIAGNSIKKDLTHEFALKEAQLKSQIDMANLAHQSSISQLKIQAQEIDILRGANSKLQLQVQDIATKALDSASGTRALDEVRSLVRDQTNAQPSKNGK